MGKVGSQSFANRLAPLVILPHPDKGDAQQHQQIVDRGVWPAEMPVDLVRGPLHDDRHANAPQDQGTQSCKAAPEASVLCPRRTPRLAASRRPGLRRHRWILVALIATIRLTQRPGQLSSRWLRTGTYPQCRRRAFREGEPGWTIATAQSDSQPSRLACRKSPAGGQAILARCPRGDRGTDVGVEHGQVLLQPPVGCLLGRGPEPPGPRWAAVGCCPERAPRCCGRTGQILCGAAATTRRV